MYTYSLSKGLFAGVSLEGAVIVTEKEKNARYYGRSVTASQVLSGKAAAPPGSAPLRNAAAR
jgi:SH3 domain-containing YSC84-like protein 1